ncbi:hypothetical protein M885DRAFT_573793 [Pelagophyceae sp. CCMP2097]|nr:hypothetical protein M885DRAFT_573793 [Pelagophyceae sp. CCMP2097]
MSACQPTSVHSLQMERGGVSRASHDKAKQLWEFKKGAAAEQAEAAGKLATLDAEIAARTTKITALRAQKTAAGVAEIAAEGGLVREGADRCAFHSGAFVGEHAKACLYNAKQLGMSVVDAMPDASKPLALEIVKKHVCLWRRLAIVHALARPSRMLAFEEVDMLKVACKDYGVAFRATFVGRNVPLKTHVLETELSAFAAKWFCCGIMCEDAAESIHALKKRLKRRYAHPGEAKMARYKRQRAAPLERFDRVEGFDATGVSGTVVTVASDAVTVQPDSVGAQCVVVARVGSGATIIPPVIQAADPDGDAVVRVPRFGQLERGDTVRAMVAGGEVHALVQGVSQSGALNCFLWQRGGRWPWWR